jgi:hypothetical protein
MTTMGDQMESAQEVEKILAAAAVAPRVRLGDVEQAIREGKVTYTVLPNGRTTVCCIELFNGRFSVTGESSCVSKENFNQALGEKFALERATEDVWAVLGAVLAYRLNKGELTSTTWLDRLKAEAKNRRAEFERLLTFLGSPAYEQLPDQERRDLVKQRECMEELCWILDRRVKRATQPPVVLGH